MIHSFKQQSPESLGISSKAIIKFIETAKKKNFNLHSAMLLRHGKTALECYFKPYAADKVHILYSLSKSFTSTAVGFAVQEGLLSIEDYAVDFFADTLPCNPCDNMRKVKIRHLLSMASGHSIAPQIFDKSDWTYHFLTSYVDKEPGSLFVYNSGATYLISAIIQKVTGETVTDYLKPRLFEPLGFSENIWWEQSPNGVDCGGFGLNLTTRDIAKFGQFLLQRGRWNGQQLLNAEWIDMATSKHIDNYGTLDWGCGYGFQFWRCQPEGVFRGDGAFGQFCVVMPEQDAVFVTTAGTEDMQQCLTAVWEILLPAMQENALPEDESEYQKLLDLCDNLQVPVDFKFKSAKIKVNDITYQLSENPIGFTSLTAHFGKSKDTLIFTTAKGEFHCEVDHHGFTDNKYPDDITISQFDPFYLNHCAAGGWLNDTTYRLYLYATYDASFDIIELTFYPDTKIVKLHFTRTMDMEPYDFIIFGAAVE